MNNTIFSDIKQDIDRKGLYYGEITVRIIYHDGRISSYYVTTTERHNCSIVSDHHNKDDSYERYRKN